MKFGKQLKLHSVPAWREHYMSYKRLKRVIAKLSMQMKMAEESMINQPVNQSTNQSTNREEKTSENSPLLAKQSNYGSNQSINQSNVNTLDRRPSISQLQRRLSQAYGSEGSENSNNQSFNNASSHSLNQSVNQSLEEFEQRSIFVSDTKKEFYAIIENDIDKVNNHFLQTINQSIDQLNRVQDQLNELGIDDSISQSISQSTSETTSLLDDTDQSNDEHTIAIGYQSTNQSIDELNQCSQSINESNESKLHKRKHSPHPGSTSRRHSLTHSINQTKLYESLSNRLFSLYKELLSLASFSKLNFEGFRKIMKKYDKNCGSTDKQSINQSINQSTSTQAQHPNNKSINQELMISRLEKEPFMQSESINQSINQIERLINQLYVARGLDLVEAKIKLRSIKQSVDDPPINDQPTNQSINLKFVFIAILVYLAIYFLPIFSLNQSNTESSKHPSHDSSIIDSINQSLNHPVDRAQKCAALLGFITTLWVTEAVPFYVSALMVPLLVILTGILGETVITQTIDPLTDETINQSIDVPYTAERASKAAFSSMFNDTIMLIIGGFSLSTAFSKCGFELMLASINQSIFGKKPKLFLLSFMFIGAFLSMFISNVAAPVLLTSILLPIVSEYWASHQSINQSNSLSDDQKYAQCLLLGLAVSCNIGGMMSPISSPQNAVALGFLEQLTANQSINQSISFFQWCTVSIPYCTITLILCWLYLCHFFLGKNAVITNLPEILYERRSLTQSDFGVIGVTFLTVSLWCTLSYTKTSLGEMGTIAVIPMVCFFGSGFLTKSDLLSFKWDLILLVGGGSVLGSAVNSSHLLQHFSSSLAPYLQGESLFTCVFTLLGIVFLITTFVSHTVAALILSPLIIHIGQSAGYTQLLTMAATLMMSGTMSLPTSSFPNINSLSQEDDWGKPFLHAKHFLIHGSAGAVISWAVLNVFALTYMRLVFGPDQ